jgi:hypothetical protein
LLWRLLWVPLVLGLLLASFACSALLPGGSNGPATPEPEPSSTAVRRATVAVAQRIIQGNLDPTATPLPTATPKPTCSGAIWWDQARAHVGESRVIQGPVVAIRPAPNATALLEVGQPYPDPTGLAVLLRADAAPAFSGKSICVSGQILNIEGTPTVQVADPSTIRVVQ